MTGRVGKRVRGSIYAHANAVDLLEPRDSDRVRQADALAGGGVEWNVARVECRDSVESSIVGLLFYYDFENDPFPALAAAARVDLQARSLRRTSYFGSRDPLILHRKELLVRPEHPRWASWAELTTRLVAAGLFRDAHLIGRRGAWAARLAEAGLAWDGTPVR